MPAETGQPWIDVCIDSHHNDIIIIQKLRVAKLLPAQLKVLTKIALALFVHLHVACFQ